MLASIIKLDGVEQHGVVSYDVEQGRVTASVLDDTGLQKPDVALYHRKGVVTVEARLLDHLVPLKMSTDDEDFDPAVGAGLVVRFNGVEQHQVYAYDIDAGTLTRAKLSEGGRVYAVDDAIATETLHGVVTVERKPV